MTIRVAVVVPLFMMMAITLQPICQPICPCITCQKARGIADDELPDGVKPGGMHVLSEWVLRHDKVLTF